MLEHLIWAIPFEKPRWELLVKAGKEPPRHAIIRRINKRYKKAFGRKPELQSPETWSEKIQWLKLNYRHPDMVTATDKYAVRSYVRAHGLGHLLVELLSVYDKADDIDFDLLPVRFVLKVNHDSGGVVVVRDKSQIDQRAIRNNLQSRLDATYIHGVRVGEWHHQFIQPRIVAEAYIGSMDRSAYDYRLQCFHGEVKLIMMSGVIEGQRYQSLYDIDWNELDASLHWPRFPFVIRRPDRLQEMLETAQILSSDFPHVRVDLYHLDEQIYFGELTFFHGGGFHVLDPIEWDYTMGNWLDLDRAS